MHHHRVVSALSRRLPACTLKLSITEGVFCTSLSEEIVCELHIHSDKHGLILEGDSAAAKAGDIDFVLGLPFGILVVFALLAFPEIPAADLQTLWGYYENIKRLNV